MTKEYKSLKNRLNQINNEFNSLLIPYKRKNSNIYQDLVKSYILLCHAEFENYIEERCKVIVSRSKSKFDTTGIVTKSLLSLSTMSSKVFEEKDKQYQTLASRIDKFYSNYFAAIEANNGIKRKDLKNLLPHIGIDYETIDETLLSQLDSFGTTRGQVAHKTIREVRDFKDVQQIVQSLLKSLTDLDIRFENLK